MKKKKNVLLPTLRLKSRQCQPYQANPEAALGQLRSLLFQREALRTQLHSLDAAIDRQVDVCLAEVSALTQAA